MPRLGFILVLVVVLGGWELTEAKRKNSRFSWRTPNYAMPWLKGSNICAVEEVIGTRKRFYSECMTYMPRKICEKPTFIRYHCCTGFERLNEASKDCDGVVPIESLLDTSKQLYLTEFHRFAKKSGLHHKLQKDGTFTVFAPNNRGFKGISQKSKQLLSSKDKQGNLLLYHMTPGRKYLRDLYNELWLPSLHSDEAGNMSPLKVNRYSSGIVTVNCARIIVGDQTATNGVLHTIERVIEPIENNATLMDRLLADDRFGELVTALIVTGLTQKLLDKEKSYTLFAPTDAAFRNAPPAVIERILNDTTILKKVLKYHMLEQRICSAAILGPSRQRTVEGQKVNLTCDINDSLRVNDIPVSQTDILGYNGVIQVIDQLLIPDAAQSLGEVLNHLDMHEFVEYAQGSGLTNVLNGKAKGNFTIFVPSADAFAGNWDAALFSPALSWAQKDTLQRQANARQRIFNYHVVPGHISTRQMVDQTALQTKSGRKVRVQVYHQGFGINGAKIISSNHVAGNGIVHVIDKMLFPPEGTSIDKIQESSKLSKLLSLLQVADMTTMLKNIHGNFTVFAPTNDAFEAMESAYLDRLLTNPVQLGKFLRYHVLKRPVYPSSIRPKLQYRFKTLSKEWLSLKQSQEDDPFVVNGDAEVEGHEIESTNGVIYHINQVLRCPCVDNISNEL